MKTNPHFVRQAFRRPPESKPLTSFIMAAAICLFFMVIPASSFGQSAGWSLRKQVGEVNAYAKLDSCAGESGKTFFIKFENTSTASAYEISYTLSVPSNPTFPPIKGKIIVNAGSSKEGSCQQAPLRGLRMPGSGSLNDLIINYTIITK